MVRKRVWFSENEETPLLSIGVLVTGVVVVVGIRCRSGFPEQAADPSDARDLARSFHGRRSSDEEGDLFLLSSSAVYRPLSSLYYIVHHVFHAPKRTTRLEITQYVNGVTRRKCTSDVSMTTDLDRGGPRRIILWRHACIIYKNRGLIRELVQSDVYIRVYVI